MEPTEPGIPGARQGNVTPPRTEEPTPVPKATPHQKTRSNAYSLKGAVPSLEKRVEVAFYTQGYYYGPMPVEEFFEDFMPYKDTSFNRRRPTKDRRDKLVEMASKTSEADMYPLFVDALRFWPPPDGEQRQIKLEYHDNHSYKDPKCGNLSVDVIVADSATKSVWRDRSRLPFSAHETHVEFKSKDAYDPFVDKEDQQREVVVLQEPEGKEEPEDEEEQEQEEYDPENAPEEEVTKDGDGDSVDSTQEGLDDTRAGAIIPSYDWTKFKFENSSNEGISRRGQLAYYAAAAMTVQYRTHFFQLIIFGTFARILRWDRSCAIVSQRFNYAEEPDLIFDFYRRLAQLDPAARGYDPQIAHAKGREARLARNVFRTFTTDGWHGRLEFPKRLQDEDIKNQSFRTLTMEGYKFVICAPAFYPDCYTPLGRSTQRSLALILDDEDNKTICFMKHFHSQNYDTTLKESEVYRRLEEKRQTDKNFPRGFCKMVTGGDVPGTESQGHNYWRARWLKTEVRQPRELIVHRIFLREVARSIRTFTNCKTMLTCVADAMEAHSYLLHELQILHRDISPGNILMAREPETPGGTVRRGFLIDFDLALDLTRVVKSKSPGRSGTFQFFSSALLRDPDAVQSGIDDRESCFHSIIYLGLLHLRHSLSEDPVRLHTELNLLFDDLYGSHKSGAFTQGLYQKFRWANQGLQKTVEALANVLRCRYIEISANPQIAALEEKDREQDMRLLEDRNWMHDTIRKYVRDMPDPPKEIDFIFNRHHPFIVTPSLKRSTQTLDTYNRQALDGHLPVVSEGDDSYPNKRSRAK